MFLRLAAAVALSALVAACVPVDTIDPPHLYLDPPLPRTPSNLPRGDYVLTNGQGEALMEATDLKPEQEHSARFDAQKLDGTINVVAMKDGKTIYTQTLTHTPGVPVRLRWDIDLERFVLTEVPPGAGGSKASDGGGGGKD